MPSNISRAAGTNDRPLPAAACPLLLTTRRIPPRCAPLEARDTSSLGPASPEACPRNRSNPFSSAPTPPDLNNPNDIEQEVMGSLREGVAVQRPLEPVGTDGVMGWGLIGARSGPSDEGGNRGRCVKTRQGLPRAPSRMPGGPEGNPVGGCPAEPNREGLRIHFGSLSLAERTGGDPRAPSSASLLGIMSNAGG